MSSTTHTLCSGSYGLISTECGPRPSSNRWSHCVHDSIDLPFPSTTTMQLRNSGVGVVACSLNDPQKPVKPGGTVAGSFSSPRLAMKMRFGDSAKMPPVDPQMYPGFANASGCGCGQLATTSYGPVRSSPPFSWSNAGDEKYPIPAAAISERNSVRI